MCSCTLSENPQKYISIHNNLPGQLLDEKSAAAAVLN